MIIKPLQSYKNDLMADPSNNLELSDQAGQYSNSPEQLVSQIIRMANRADKLAEMLPIILNQTMEGLQFEGGAVFLFKLDGRTLNLACSCNYPETFEQISDDLYSDEDFYNRLVNEQQILVARHQRPFSSREIFLNPFILSITLPMIHKHRPVGILQLLSSRKNQIIENESSTLRCLAEESAVMIQRVKRLEQALENEQSCYGLLNAVSDMVFAMDYQGNILNANPAAYKALGTTREKLTSQKLEDLFLPAHQARAHQVIEDYLTKGQVHYQLPMYNLNGEVIPVEAKMAKVTSQNQDMLFTLCRELPQTSPGEGQIRTPEELYRQIFEQATDGIILYDIDGGIVAYNRSILEMTGYSEAEVKKCSILDFVVPEHLPMIQAKMSERKDNNHTVSAEVGIVAKGGRRIEMEINTSPFNGIKDVRLFQAIARDITERKKNEEKLKYLSLHDGLTGMYNRNYFEEELNRMEAGTVDPIGMILCDVDGLKMTNDFLGHQSGDELLKQAAGIIKDCFRDCDVSARIGGDEFCILLPGTDWNGVQASLKRLEKAVEKHNSSNPPIPVRLSKGCSVRYVQEQSMREALKDADERMYKDKVDNYARFNNIFTAPADS